MAFHREIAGNSWLGLRRPESLFALAVAFACLGYVSEAQAGCGHYVRRLGPDFVPGKFRAAEGASQVSTAMQTPSLPVHCSGPQCQQQRTPQPPLVPPLPPSQSTPEGAVISSGSELLAAAPAIWKREDFYVRPLAGYRELPHRPPNG
jgi:hypothetical protein